MQTIDRDVVIIGAGPSGLNAARRLVAAGKSVAVLEARDRVGGRTWSDTIDGAFIEIGGQWISPDQTALKALVAELGKETFQRYREGASVYIDQAGERHVYSGDDEFPVSAETSAAMDTMIAELDKLAAEIGPTEPWAHPRAAELDTISFHDWLHSIADDDEAVNNIALYIAGGMLTKPAYAFSALQAILMAASAGSFSNLIDEDFILDERVVGGMQSVSVQVAEELGDDVVFLNNPVRFLEWSDNGPGAAADVTARTDSMVANAKHAIVAVPPNLYSRISYEPPLPRMQHVVHQHISMGLVIKVHAVYGTPFWREDGLSASCFGASRIIQEVYDNTNHGDTRGTLVGFISDEKAERIWAMSEEDRREAILSELAAYLGEKARDVQVLYLSDWGNEEWTRGAYATSYDLGGLHRWGALQNEPVGPIFFASSDIAAEGYQHVDGAVRIGQATAQRILDA
ncbi:FAD-dependent oxidoreductase [Pseudoclavibacter chungangensis]|uniref:FAD-dependent oxidoreductase n=1 Tax=Pseudoclavibacter chungangensis TaxID=587635 RepID=A0A7J5BM50_9MICO|nr:NAD(P)/FAD-dependent oxidoreductase [Pseudoclavibacter chungangensis]KAB1652225.1 FAD-dependent oxidoreductase [Pseudoclavibacter chungangensis]NYJ67585.1 putrescine oxidase [Pseudoclavibacter chungangensis]